MFIFRSRETIKHTTLHPNPEGDKLREEIQDS